jgi:hypothetical protein
MTITTLSDKSSALIIGINDYTAFDGTGASNLKGSVNDAAAVARLCLALGMKRDDVHVVSSQVDGESPDLLEVKRNEDTSQKGIYAEIEWLKGQLEAGRPGLLWYSGHGAHTTKDGLLLCPSDTTSDLSNNTIPFSALRSTFKGVADNLTVVLDCCHGGSVTDHLGRTSTTLGGDPKPDDIADDEMEIGAIVLTACAVGEQTQQSSFASHWHGAFTWALLSVVDQWQKAQQSGNVRIDLTNRELIKKATVLLDALDFEGSPQIYPRGAGGLAVLQQGYQAMATVDRPDGERPGIQLQPDMRYDILLPNIGNMFVYAIKAGKQVRFKNSDGTTMLFPETAPTADTEYWFDSIDWTKFQYNSCPTSITIRSLVLQTDPNNSNVYEVNESMPCAKTTYNSPCDASSTWRQQPPSPTGAPTRANGSGAYYFRNSSTSPTMVLEIDTDGTSTTKVVWWNSSQSTGTINPTRGAWNNQAPPDGSGTWWVKGSL